MTKLIQVTYKHSSNLSQIGDKVTINLTNITNVVLSGSDVVINSSSREIILVRETPSLAADLYADITACMCEAVGSTYSIENIDYHIQNIDSCITEV